jgi:flagellar protein FlbD
VNEGIALMIHVTHLDHTGFVLNCDLIEQIEATPDTVITLTNNRKLTVLESPDEIVDRVRAFRRSVLPHRTAEVISGKSGAAFHRG